MSLFIPVALFAMMGVAGSCKNLIIDTDLFSDCDDAAALLLAATFSSACLLAVNVNHRSRYTALAASAILNHYGHSDVPIGRPFGPATDETFFDSWLFELGEFASKVGFHYSGGTLPWDSNGEDGAWDGVDLYRKALGSADDGSVTIVSVGYFENLSGLLNSTGDAYSSVSGPDLVASKVAELVVMGGGYPYGHEWNFWGSNASLAAHVVDVWRTLTPVTYIGDELGTLVVSGDGLLADGPKDDPVRAAYEWYTYGYGNRSSWDPLAMLWALGAGTNLLEFANDSGYNMVRADGSNEWVEDGKDWGQHWLKLKSGLDGAEVGKELDGLYLRGAWRHASNTARGDRDWRDILVQN